MRKILPFNIDVIVKSYHHHAFSLGIISAHEKEYLNYVINNYNQLVWYDHLGEYNGYELNFDLPFFLYSDPFIREHLDHELFEEVSNLSICDFLIRSLLLNRYIYLCVDEFYLNKSINYNKEHCIHDLMIYGFDDMENIFFCAGYDKSLHYKDLQYTFEEIIKSKPQNIELLKFNHINCQVNEKYLKQSIYDLIYPESYLIHESRKYEDNRIYGFDVFAKLKEYITQCKINHKQFNIITFCLIKEFLSVINLIIEKVSINYYYVLEKNYSLMDNIIQLTIKYNISCDSELL